MFVDLSSEPVTEIDKEQFCVEIMKRLDIQRRNEQFCDVILEVGSGDDQARLKAHRIVLCAASPFFYNALNSDMKEKKEGVIRLEETSKAVMEEVLEYLYTGHVDINEHDVFDFMVAADYFLIQSLKELASNFILDMLSSGNCFFAYYSAKKYQWKAVEEGARDFILANFEAVTKCVDFLKLSIEQVEEWICSDEITVDGEESVFEAILRWLEGDVGRDQRDFSKLLCHVRCVYVSRDYLFKVILPHPLVKESLECSDMVLNAMKLAFDGSEECFFSQPPRNCLKTHEDAIVICSQEIIRCYIPSQSKWYLLSVIPTRRILHRYATGACHGKLYVIGGVSTDDVVERYDPSINTWATAKALKPAPDRSAAVTLQGFLYVVGGRDSSNNVLSIVQKYNPDTNLWQEVSSLSSPRSSVCAVADGSYLYAIGGISSTDRGLSIVERFDPRSNTWEKLPPTFAARVGAGGAFFKQKVFVFGGISSQLSNGDPTIEVFDPAANMWTAISNGIAPRYHHDVSAVSFKGKIYVLGTFQNGGVKKLQTYDSENNTWELCSENYPLSGICKASCLRIPRDVLSTCND